MKKEEVSDAAYLCLAKIVLKESKEHWGSGWLILSQMQRQAYLDQRILFLLLAQVAPVLQPAKDLVRGVREEVQRLSS